MRWLLLQAMIIVGASMLAQIAWSQEYDWQKVPVKLLPNGDMEWAPEPYAFQPGPQIRYIDFEAGDDNAAGTSKQTAWKHHPWDLNATGKAAEASGPLTYVFKGGVIYRGQMLADESGTPEQPIQLLHDPDWGDGKPLFYGSSRLPDRWVRADKVQYPDRLPDPATAWALDLKGEEYMRGGSPRYAVANRQGYWAGGSAIRTSLHVIEESGEQRRLHLARTPDWQPGSDNFMLDYWYQAEEDANVKGFKITGFVDSRWKDPSLPEDYFTGGTIWSMTRTLIATATPKDIPETVEWKGKTSPFFIPEKGILMHTNRGRSYGKKGVGIKYMIENLPQFMDAPNEFYLDHDNGMLYLRLPEGEDPNKLTIELSNHNGCIQIENQSHIEIAGLSFSFYQSDTIGAQLNVSNLDIHHCNFRNALDVAIRLNSDASDDAKPVMDQIRVADCRFEDINTNAIKVQGQTVYTKHKYRGFTDRVQILRNYTYNTGIRHGENTWGNVSAIGIGWISRGEIAGNIVRRSLGSGIVVEGGKNGSLSTYETRSMHVPHIRILVHHNKTEDTALGVSDYGGLALWQGGPIYAWSNLIGNSPGHNPAGFFGFYRPINLSYPIYLDGGFKMYLFNNIVWGRTTDEKDPFANTTAGYFSVFGFLNQFTNNTVYRTRKGVGGSSGNRNDIVSNIFADIAEKYIANNREGDPSLLGGGDDASSGLRGVPSLAFAHNLFHGKGDAGTLISAEGKRRDFVVNPVDAKTVDAMQEQMAAFPIRIPLLGKQVEKSPIIGAPPGPIDELCEQVDFAPTPDSPALDEGGIYFVPWSLYGTVGEWQFTVNHADPTKVTDYHFFMDETHFDRKSYELLPSFDLVLDQANVDHYVDGITEDWVPSAMRFDGKRFARYPDAPMREDIKLPIVKFHGTGSMSEKERLGEPWTIDEPSGQGGKFSETDMARYPAEKRQSLIITTQNLLIEAQFRAETGGMLLGKYDGQSGYALQVGEDGKARFLIAAGGKMAAVSTAASVNDGNWHHVIGEVDRASGRMTIYLDGKEAGSSQTSLGPDVSIDTTADVLVAKAHDDSARFTGDIDFLRVCRGTLADSLTDIAELYAWQTNGPFRYDYFGSAPKGRRDVGAIERIQR